MDVFHVLDWHSFAGTVIRDEHTEVMPRDVNGATWIFYFVIAVILFAISGFSFAGSLFSYDTCTAYTYYLQS